MNALLSRLHSLATEQPQLPALSGDDLSLDYATLWALIERQADWLRQRGSRVVALLADNSPHWAGLDLACQLAGVTFLPLPTFFTPAQCLHAMTMAGSDLLIAAPAELAHAAGAIADAGCLPGTSWPVWSLPDAVAGVLPAGTAKITFTSGSTGQPKGVCLSQKNQVSVAAALAVVLADPAPRHLCVLPLSTLLENIAGVYAPLLCGGEVLLPSLARLGYCGSQPLQHQHFLAVITQARPTSLILVPQLLDLLTGAALRCWPVPESLRFVAVGGSRVAATALARARQLGIPAYEGYGLSECGSVVSLNLPGRDLPGSAGQVLPHLDVRVDAHGELHVGGNVFLGYAGMPESWGASSVATGDLGLCDDQGFIRLAGRRKHLLINSYGRNISPEWVESELLAHPQLLQCVVVGDARPSCAALIHAPDLDDEALACWLAVVNDGLPDYARVRHIARLPEALTAVDGLLTANGRPRRDVIAARYQSLIDSLYPDHEESLAS